MATQSWSRFMLYPSKEAQFFENWSLVTEEAKHDKIDVAFIVFFENLEKVECYATVTLKCYELMVITVHSNCARTIAFDISELIMERIDADP